MYGALCRSVRKIRRCENCTCKSSQIHYAVGGVRARETHHTNRFRKRRSTRERSMDGTWLRNRKEEDKKLRQGVNATRTGVGLGKYPLSFPQFSSQYKITLKIIYKIVKSTKLIQLNHATSSLQRGARTVPRWAFSYCMHWIWLLPWYWRQRRYCGMEQNRIEWMVERPQS